MQFSGIVTMTAVTMHKKIFIRVKEAARSCFKEQMSKFLPCKQDILRIKKSDKIGLSYLTYPGTIDLFHK